MWCIIDERTGQRVGSATYPSRARAELTIIHYRERARLHRHRPDLSLDTVQAFRAAPEEVFPW